MTVFLSVVLHAGTVILGGHMALHIEGLGCTIFWSREAICRVINVIVPSPWRLLGELSEGHLETN